MTGKNTLLFDMGKKIGDFLLIQMSAAATTAYFVA